MKTIRFLLLLLHVIVLSAPLQVFSQEMRKIQLPDPGEKTLMNSGWYARRANEVRLDGNQLTMRPFNPDGWMKAKVPGTVLTTMLENNMFPAPEVSLNNNLIPDIYVVGKEFYTYWFVCPFKVTALDKDRQIWLNFRGINYKADIFLNGKRINSDTQEGMFLRHSYRITDRLKENEVNLLAVIVYPPDYPGNANGGQGGDGQIARNVTMQFTPGWDWIQPVRDRNTGIWDEVSLTTTEAVRIQHPYVVTKVPGIRQPDGNQADAFVRTTVEVENTSAITRTGTLVCETSVGVLRQNLTLAPFEKRQVAFKELTVKNPRLWWPNGVGEQNLYDMRVTSRWEGWSATANVYALGFARLDPKKALKREVAYFM